MKKNKPLICKNCNKDFLGWHIKQKCCSQSCASKLNSKLPNSKCFKKGIEVWNKGLKGIHLSPKSEFKKGNRPGNWRRVGSIRKQGMDFYIKIANPNKWQLYPRFIYEKKHGKIPVDKVIIHKDFQRDNNDIENLKAVTRAESISYFKDLRNAFNPRFNFKNIV